MYFNIILYLISNYFIRQNNIGIEDRVAIVESHLPSLDILNCFYDDYNEILSIKFAESAWENRIIWHYLQPYYSHAHYEYSWANILSEYKSSKEEKVKLYKSCRDTMDNIMTKTMINLPSYFTDLHSQCTKRLEELENN